MASHNEGNNLDDEDDLDQMHDLDLVDDLDQVDDLHDEVDDVYQVDAKSLESGKVSKWLKLLSKTCVSLEQKNMVIFADDAFLVHDDGNEGYDWDQLISSVLKPNNELNIAFFGDDTCMYLRPDDVIGGEEVGIDSTTTEEEQGRRVPTGLNLESTVVTRAKIAPNYLSLTTSFPTENPFLSLLHPDVAAGLILGRIPNFDTSHWVKVHEYVISSLQEETRLLLHAQVRNDELTCFKPPPDMGNYAVDVPKYKPGIMLVLYEYVRTRQFGKSMWAPVGAFQYAHPLYVKEAMSLPPFYSTQYPWSVLVGTSGYGVRAQDPFLCCSKPSIFRQWFHKHYPAMKCGGWVMSHYEEAKIQWQHGCAWFQCRISLPIMKHAAPSFQICHSEVGYTEGDEAFLIIQYDPAVRLVIYEFRCLKQDNFELCWFVHKAYQWVPYEGLKEAQAQEPFWKNDEMWNGINRSFSEM